MALIYVGFVAVFLAQSGYSMTKSERSELRETVKDMFLHAYDSYMTYAFPADELMPLNCKGRYRETEPSRGDVDDILGNFSMTLIDSLDSLVIFGEVNKFEEAVRLVIDEVTFDNDIVVSTFETNIRVLGGLLGGHVVSDLLRNQGVVMDWYNDELLDMAKDIGERLMPAFNTTTGIPYPKVNLRYGVADPRSRTGSESATCTACAGTIIMEFGALSRLTGDPKFENAAHKAMKALWTYRSRSSDLVGTVINIHNGEWVRRDSGVGAGIDSYYEYCLKAYILLGEEDYLQRFNQHYKAVMRYINRDSMFLNVHMNNPSKRSVSYMDSLQAFWPGLQVLKGDLKSAIELHEVFYSVAKRHTFLPEAFTTNFEVHWGQHFLRPELVESTYFLFEATKDPYYLQVGKYIVENLNRYTRVPCGFAAVKDVRTLSHENRMDSFLLSETLKYLYLLFTDKEDLLIDLHDFVFTTEAHILPLALSNWNSSSSQSNIYASENLHDHSCPRTTRDESMLSFAEKIRRKSRQSSDICPKRKEKLVKSKSTAPLLRAEQFIPGNKDHLLILKAMGITVTKTDDGKVQLMQDASSADNSDMAGEGVIFMQSMIELAKFRGNDGEYLPRVVEILSPPYNGNIVLNAGPAQFGIDLGTSGMGVSAEVILADPFKGCTELKNEDEANRRIVVMERGDCMFIDKVRVAESLGAVAAIIIDNNKGSSSESQPLFAMSGDETSSDINIPAVFLFSNEGQVLLKAMQIVKINSGANLKVRLGDKALKRDEIKEKSTTDPVQSGNQKQADQMPKEKGKEDNLDKPEAKNIEGVESEVNKLIDLMKNVVKQPGFQFLTGNGQLRGKAQIMMADTADVRERWLYDVMMENSKLRKESLGQKGDGVFAIRSRKVGSSDCDMNEVGKERECLARKTRDEFLNTVTRSESEFIVLGDISKGSDAIEDPYLIKNNQNEDYSIPSNEANDSSHTDEETEINSESATENSQTETEERTVGYENNESTRANTEVLQKREEWETEQWRNSNDNNMQSEGEKFEAKIIEDISEEERNLISGSGEEIPTRDSDDWTNSETATNIRDGQSEIDVEDNLHSSKESREINEGGIEGNTSPEENFRDEL